MNEMIKTGFYLSSLLRWILFFALKSNWNMYSSSLILWFIHPQELNLYPGVKVPEQAGIDGVEQITSRSTRNCNLPIGRQREAIRVLMLKMQRMLFSSSSANSSGHIRV